MGQIEFSVEANWQPLQLVIADEETRREFMFMGTFVKRRNAQNRAL